MSENHQRSSTKRSSEQVARVRLHQLVENRSQLLIGSVRQLSVLIGYGVHFSFLAAVFLYRQHIRIDRDLLHRSLVFGAIPVFLFAIVQKFHHQWLIAPDVSGTFQSGNHLYKNLP